MSKIQILLTSPTFYTILGLFVYNGLAAIVPDLSGGLQTGANIVLGVLFLYVHPTEVQKAAGTAV
jgi:hypothetical protein